MKAKIYDPERHGKNKNVRYLYRGISCDFNKNCQPRTNIVKDEKGDLVADCHSIVARWRKHYCQLFSVQYMGLTMLGRQKYTQQSRYGGSDGYKKLKIYKSPRTDQIQRN